MAAHLIARVMVDGKEYAASYVVSSDRVYVYTETDARSVPIRKSMRPAELAQIIAIQMITATRDVVAPN
jgi:hypothetical protein